MSRTISGAVVLTIGLIITSSTAIAGKGECDQSQGAERQNRLQTMRDANMEKLHTALQLTPAQETAWTDFSEKMNSSYAAAPKDKDWRYMSTPDRMDKMLDNMKSREALMTARAAAVRQFYANLSDDQQKIFDKRFQRRDPDHVRRALYHVTK